MENFYEKMSKKELYDKWIYWEKTAHRHGSSEKYYREQLAKAHEILGRIIHQFSERWDSINLTEHYPTDNLHHTRTIKNPKGCAGLTGG